MGTDVATEQEINTEHYFNWKPLYNLLCDGWMFMGKDANGYHRYKHQTTRGKLILTEAGEVFHDSRTGNED